MGLNMDAHFLNLMPLEESELRNQIYWSLYCVDKLMSSYIGRVCTLLVGYLCLELRSLRLIPLRILKVW
jgi:hypothetical protein